MNTADRSEMFEIQRGPVARYFYWSQILLILLIFIWFVGAGIPLALIFAVTWGPSLSRRQADALRYWIDAGTLRVDEGVYFLKRKAIPLDRVTDIALVQGPLMRSFGIWALQVQTAGAGHAVPEATLCGVVNPDRLRDQLLAARDRAVAERRKD
jgi:putative membrane protein